MEALSEWPWVSSWHVSVELRGATLSSVLDRVEWNGENLLPSASGVAASSSSSSSSASSASSSASSSSSSWQRKAEQVVRVRGTLEDLRGCDLELTPSRAFAGVLRASLVYVFDSTDSMRRVEVVTSVGVRWKLTAGPVSLRSVILVNESLRLSMRDTLSMALRRAAVSPELSAALASIGSGPASGWSSSKFEVERVDMWVSDSSTSALAYRVAHNVSSAEEGTEQHAGDVAHGVVWSPWQKNSSVIGASASWCSSADVVLLQKPDVAQSIVVHTNVSFLDPSSLLAVLVRVEHEVVSVAHPRSVLPASLTTPLLLDVEQGDVVSVHVDRDGAMEALSEWPWVSSWHVSVELRGATLSSVLDRVEWNGENLLPSASGVAASSSSSSSSASSSGVVVVVKLAKEGGASRASARDAGRSTWMRLGADAVARICRCAACVAGVRVRLDGLDAPRGGGDLGGCAVEVDGRSGVASFGDLGERVAAAVDARHVVDGVAPRGGVARAICSVGVYRLWSGIWLVVVQVRGGARGHVGVGQLDKCAGVPCGAQRVKRGRRH
ncbi:hypothetical protein PINS_up021456 [Pythium insidiosum]|nr:hypothetical protein PINS_up021456 [Pythium insidiosum]